VYNFLNNSESLYPENIGTQFGGLSGEYVNQIILALQKGGIEIKSVPGQTSNARPRVKYTMVSRLTSYDIES
jgi:hypothetical protein